MGFRTNIRRAGIAATAIAAMAGASVFAASSASASPGDEACVSGAQGGLCVYETSSGYNAAFASDIYDLVDQSLDHQWPGR